MPGKKGLDVDRRVGIALGALAHGQRLVVSRILQSTRRFAASVANEANVKTINGGDPPLYSLRVTPELRLVYEKSGNGFPRLSTWWIGPPSSDFPRRRQGRKRRVGG